MAIRTGYGCPACRDTSGDVNEILAEDRQLICSKVPAHVFPDMDAFIDMKPVMAFEQAKVRPAPQTNHTSVNVSIAVNTYNALLEKYGDRLNATLAGLLNVIAEGQSLIVTETDLQRLKTVFNEMPKNSSHLFGLVYAMQLQTQEAKQTAQLATDEVKAYENISPGKVVLDLGEHFNYVVDRAKSEGLPTKMWMEQQVKNALANQWF